MPRPLWIGLAAAMLVLAAVSLHVGVPIYRQRVAIREIERVKGEVLLTRPRGPEWLRGLLGDRWKRLLLDEVVSVNLADSEVTDSTLVHLKELPGLEHLWLNRTGVSDAGLANLAGLVNLQELGLQGTRVTDLGLAHLTGLTRLEILFLSQTDLTDAGLQHLVGFNRLQKLSIENTKVTDAGLARLSVLERSGGWLNVGESKVTRTGIAENWRALPKIEIRD